MGLRAGAGVARLGVAARSYDLFIGGAWVAPTDGTRVATLNPATEEPLAEVSFAGPGDVAAAVAAARAAAAAWAALPAWSAASTCSGSRG